MYQQHPMLSFWVINWTQTPKGEKRRINEEIKTEFSVTRPKSEQHNDESVCVLTVWECHPTKTPRIDEMHTPK